MMKTIQTVVEETSEQRAILDENMACMSEAQNFAVSSPTILSIQSGSKIFTSPALSPRLAAIIFPIGILITL